MEEENILPKEPIQIGQFDINCDIMNNKNNNILNNNNTDNNNNNNESDKESLSSKVKKAFQNKPNHSHYKKEFLTFIQNENENFQTTKFKREQLLNRLLDEKIPKSQIMKKTNDKDNNEAQNQEYSKDEFFIDVFQNIYNTLSPAASNMLNDEELDKNLKEFGIDSTKKYDVSENDFIFDLCHNFVTLDEICNRIKEKEKKKE